MSSHMVDKTPDHKCQDSSGLTCEFSQNLDILRQIDLFSALPIESLKVFALMSSREKYKAGDVLFQQGEDDGQAFYIFAGTGELVYKGDGPEEVIRTVGAGQMVGATAILGETPRLFSFRAVTDLECFLMEREKFRTTLEQFPAILPKIIKTLVQKIHAREKVFLTSRNPDCEACKKNLGVIFD
ncbi:Cyclic nucleotide-binding domain-containing protein [Desulfatibacillum alkenivorans DSM 16219]|uniref:Cyclic nucleotide-binding domain-containing protein n=1 Tax=Desulfatibacillum alkenivorans DSM 16219 TaxID=1121393 RepID=A0A1M6HDJ1_9BACT|nr:Crp/Fnr family transcriptional regulator [Desulfatibacillum alkenivorans]SHJ20277.1 Cyclic nucleotide-binding domain-containing protein [Desulfatibacillum alkenivorans DSM 16219]